MEVKIKNAMLIGEKFPGKRVDFIMKQAVKLLKIKPDSRMIVLSGKEKTDESESPKAKSVGLYEKIDYLSVPSGYSRFKEIPKILNHPIAFAKSLSFKYYPMNYTLKPYLIYNEIKKLPYKIDLLHCHFGQIGIIGSYLKKMGVCKKLAVSFYGGDITGYPKTYGKEIFKDMFENADYIITCTNFLKRKLIEHGADPKKIIMFYLPQDPGFFTPSKNKKKSREIRILTVARLVPEKGVQNAIRAMSILSKKYRNVKYAIVGDGDYRIELEKLVSSLGLQNIEFRGLKGGKDKLEEYQSSDIFVLPSISTHKGWVEGGGLSNLEAGLCELPVVASNCGGIPEYVLAGVSGLLAEENPEDLANKISVLIDNPSLRKKFGKAGARHVKSIFSIKNLEALEDVYNE